MATSNSALRIVDGPAWLGGFTNMARKEAAAWWGTRRWWVQSLVWFLIVNGIVALLLWIVDDREAPPPTEVFQVFFNLFALAAIGAIVLLQSAIVGEKSSGTAEWVLSNPVSRSAFVLAKLIANAVFILLILIVLQGAIGYAQFSMHGGVVIRSGAFVAAMGVLSLHLLFYITLVLWLGTCFRSRGPVVGISLAVLMGQNLLGTLISELLPWVPSILPGALPELAVPVAMGQGLPEVTPLITTAVFSLLFVLLAIWRFGREQF